MIHVEEREFSLRVVMRCEFTEDYEGELDGYAWAEEMPSIINELVRAAAGVLGQRPGWQLMGGNRGRPSEEEVTLVLTKRLSGSGADRDPA